ncbi:LysR family transcriptional regulator substrate-binding protein [Nonomuraea sp. NPDC049758]|uniref:LysR family transcriptional regulator substrate-binding protein n=1 Tax=Nonomuraea sp. NPDC049758 TaxID=3154360 RepID=UPI0034268F59
MAAAAGEVTGPLRLASLPSVTGTLIAHRLRTFTDRHPQVQVRLFEGADDDVRGWLRGGAAEVGVVTLPAPGLHTIPLSAHEMVTVVPASHRLAGQPFILTTAGCRPLITDAARQAGVQLDVAYEAGGQSAILDLAEQ